MRKDILPIITKIRNNETLTTEEKQYFIKYSLTTDHTGKMEGLTSSSTSVLDNPFCQCRRENKKFVCHDCYAAAQLEYQHTNAEKQHANYIFYNNVKLSASDVPFLDYAFFRYESFGDIASELCQVNYNTIARRNKHTRFTQWSKNIALIAKVFSYDSKPKNLDIIYSIPRYNYIPSKHFIECFRKKYPFVKKIFVVLTPEYAEANNIDFTCKKNCSDCLKCYDPKNKEFIIYEIKKTGS